VQGAAGSDRSDPKKAKTAPYFPLWIDENLSGTIYETGSSNGNAGTIDAGRVDAKEFVVVLQSSLNDLQTETVPSVTLSLARRFSRP
jgi:hypothetical protein